MCKFGAHRTTPTAKKWDSRGDIFAMAKMGRVSGFWRFLGKYLGTGQKIPYWEPTGENPWISGPEYIPTLNIDANSSAMYDAHLLRRAGAHTALACTNAVHAHAPSQLRIAHTAAA